MTHVILHAGLHKTGTSYIQSFLALNRDRLKAAGVGYPELGPLDSHNRFVGYVRGGGKRDGNIGQWLEKQLKSNKTLILSAEEFSQDFNSPKQLTHYADLFEGHDVSVVYYLRRQDELRESVFAQICKDFYSGVIEGDLPFSFDFEVRLRYVQSTFGSSLILRPYNASHWWNGDIGCDLLWHALGIDARLYEKPERKNESLPRRATLLLSRLVAERPFRSRIVDRLRHFDFLAYDGVKSLASPASRAEFFAGFTDSNMRALRNFGISEVDDFFGPRTDTTEWRAVSPLSEAEFATLEADFSIHEISTDVYRFLDRD